MIRAEQERRARGWSKAEVSRRSGINQVTVIEILNGTRKASASYAPRFAKAFEWTADPAELLQEVEPNA